jgi:hypothetical protein
MSLHGTLSNGTGRGPGRPRASQESEDIAFRPGEPITNLMKRMGSKNGGFDPIPPDQIRWVLRDPKQSPINRLWAWMHIHTEGHPPDFRREYAVRVAGENVHVLRLSDAAKELGGKDPGSIRREWRTGERLGLWRRGTKEEGEDRLYFLAHPELSWTYETAQYQEGEEKAGRSVQTSHFHPKLKKLKGKLKDEEMIKLSTTFTVISSARLEFAATLMAAGRFIEEHQQDIAILELVKDIPIPRQKHRKKGESEEEANERRYGRFEAILPALEKYFVQTFLEKSVQTAEKVCTESKTALYRPPIIIEKNKEREEKKDQPASQSVTVVTEAPAAATNGHLPAGWPDADSQNPSPNPSRRTQLTEYLRQFKIPDPLNPHTVDRIAEEISTEALFDQFRDATAPERFPGGAPRKWVLLIQIAKRVAKDGARYEQAGLVERKPMTRLERLAQEMREERAHGH